VIDTQKNSMYLYIGTHIYRYSQLHSYTHTAEIGVVVVVQIVVVYLFFISPRNLDSTVLTIRALFTHLQWPEFNSGPGEADFLTLFKPFFDLF